MTGSCGGLVCTVGKATVLSVPSPVGFGPAVAVARLRSSLLVWIRSTGVPGTRSYHMTCSPVPSAVIQGWKRSFIVTVVGPALICCGMLHVLLLSREKLRKILVALVLSPPTPPGRSFQTASRTPFCSMVVLGISKLRASCPLCASITSRGSAALLH